MQSSALVVNKSASSAITAEEFAYALGTFDVEGKLAIACSGGVDSLALAFLASQTHQITALIVDHNLRPESADEALATSKILSNLGIENHILKVEKKIESNIQEGAREARYELMLNFCRENNIRYLATAHHADDNAETILLKLSRGSSVDGLCGIKPINEIDGIKIIRPLLGFSKTRLTATLTENNINWVEDPSNKTDKYKRNQVRHLLENLEDQELITTRLNDTAENMLRVRDFLEQQTEEAEKDCIHQNEMNLEEFKKLHMEIAYRLLTKLTTNQNGERARFEKIKKLHDAIIAGNKHSLGGKQFSPQNNKIIISIENS